VVRGLALTSDDLVRRAVIMALMCQGELQFEAVELAYMIDFKQYFAAELSSLKSLEKEGLVILDDRSIQVTSWGWFFVRGVAMHFDRYLQTDQNRARFSKII
jgi:oxygen-independent coproporphyrinogen-3 oxidase